MRRHAVILLLSLLALGVLASPAIAQGSLTVTYTTQSHGGPYAPAHVVAVWVEDAGGTFVSTVDRWAGVRKQHLVAWTQKAGAADADAVSGATRISHTQPLTATWDLRDRQGQVIPDGTYTIRMELADSNASQPLQNAQGTFTFTKTAAGSEQTGLSNGGFTNVSITHAPGADPPADGGGGGGAGGDAGVVADDRPDMITGGCSTTSDAPALGILLAAFLFVRRPRRR
jgi:MYXO-CTERM domain-containing protein